MGVAFMGVARGGARAAACGSGGNSSALEKTFLSAGVIGSWAKSRDNRSLTISRTLDRIFFCFVLDSSSESSKVMVLFLKQ